VDTDDWYKYRGVASDENLQMAGNPVPHTTLATALARNGALTSVVLTSTAGMPATGSVVIEGEAITYTSIAGSTLNGCSRGAYSSEKSAHAVGCAVSQGMHWIKINGGLIYCGLQMPS
jgi:hypothetical protein